jgi:hypothetical protein
VNSHDRRCRLPFVPVVDSKGWRSLPEEALAEAEVVRWGCTLPGSEDRMVDWPGRDWDLHRVRQALGLACMLPEVRTLD